jgi:NAD(P)-dependent dehydrogenase (short-subunit alcohol dehydrogenase family)
MRSTARADKPREDMMNRVWLITWANSGFGRAITEAAVAADDTVLAAANVRALDDLVAAHPGQVEALALDVMDTASIGETVQDICDRHGRSDVLVNNAG